MTVDDPTLFSLDAAYKRFPSFAEWEASLPALDLTRWQRYNQSIESRKHLAPQELAQARGVATRAAAIDTGALEDLYESDRGFTFTVAFETASWEAALASKGEQVKSLFEAQLEAYDYVLDLATRAEPLSEAALRSLHEVICRAQETYRVVTAVGPQEQPLPRGVYKALPNHVRTRHGTYHSYAPVDITPSEMERLMRELRSDAFLKAHPVRQAAYAHYCFVVIHPFADGNGRVARALASAFTYRSISMPIMILTEHKEMYLESLASADEGDYSAFENFLLARSLDTLSLIDDSLQNGVLPSPQTVLEAVEQLYITKGGYTQDQVEAAGQSFIGLLHGQLDSLTKSLRSSKLTLSVNLSNNAARPSATHRTPVSGNSSLHLFLQTSAPAVAQESFSIYLSLPKNAGGEDDLFLSTTTEAGGALGARMDEIIPRISGVLQIRAKMFAERVMSKAMERLIVKARKHITL